CAQEKSARQRSAEHQIWRREWWPLRLGDVRKACSHPAPSRLVLPLLWKLSRPSTRPQSWRFPLPRARLPPTFSSKVVLEALSSFPATSAADLFGYRPSLLQQCVRSDSTSFLRT